MNLIVYISNGQIINFIKKVLKYMKNILSKVILTFIIVTVFVIGLKVSDNILANADASTNNTNVCGVNNGWILSGSQCVNTCDINHPWDPYSMRCSGGAYYSQTYYNSQNPNCAVYGANFYYNGKNCVKNTISANANYYGNPYNGGTQSPVYGVVNFQNLANNNVYNNTNSYYGKSYVNSGNQNYTQNYPHTTYATSNSASTGSGPKTTDYYIYTTTTTTSQPSGTPIYLGNPTTCSISCYGSNYYGGTNYSSSNSNYTNYNYTNSNSNVNYDYINSNSNSDYTNYSGSYSSDNVHYDTGYYDEYGMYHY